MNVRVKISLQNPKFWFQNSGIRFKMPKEVFRILLFASTWTDTKFGGVTLFLRKIVDRIIIFYL